ncbi:flagellar basal body rod protein [Terribacillus sp. DMT04]|uniref:lmo0954 family membrane protein n=1 Tax=Terribacillus sp. DMT04 TaxID=2850441 RepID=UPI001C2C2B4E|nr:flagellar basal body rod protein [Terribacillus sp. DMT04]QXE01232.1 flagellar basal body rod protein [Terribacillus sp. DMT04]
MKKVLLIIGAVVAVAVLLANLGSLLVLAISVAVGYYGLRRFVMTDAVGAKIGWGVVIGIGVCISLSNLPALIGLAALAALYYMYKAWKKDKEAEKFDFTL